MKTLNARGDDLMNNEQSSNVNIIDQASWMTPPRLEQPELLDMGLGSASDVAANLNEMWRANRYLGGLRALTCHLYPRLIGCKEMAITLADVGTGSAEIPARIARWARRHDLDVKILAVDRAARNLDAARCHGLDMPEIVLVQADANGLPFAQSSVDFVISSMFLHHLSAENVVQHLRSAFSVARRGIIMSDLARGWLPLAAFKVSQPIIAHNFLTRHDGALSIRRAYTPAELRGLAAAAGLPNARVYRHWAWRLTLVVDR